MGYIVYGVGVGVEVTVVAEVVMTPEAEQPIISEHKDAVPVVVVVPTVSTPYDKYVVQSVAVAVSHGSSSPIDEKVGIPSQPILATNINMDFFNIKLGSRDKTYVICGHSIGGISISGGKSIPGGGPPIGYMPGTRVELF
jgi:hypothetical protein